MNLQRKSAVEQNRVAIMLMIQSMGPQTLDAIARECQIQANGNLSYVLTAINDLEQQGALFREIDDDGEIVFDEPCQPWPENPLRHD